MNNYLLIGIFIGCISAAGYYYQRKCIKKLNEIDDNIDKAQDFLKEFKQEDFVIRFEDINQHFIKNQTLKSSWNDFRKTITSYTEDDGTKRLYSSVDASEFFSFSRFTSSIGMSFWQSYGGIFTGLGILGTFLGLTIGLSGLDMTSSNIDSLKQGITGLLSGVKFSFLTSLIGIIVGLGHGYYHNYKINNLKKHIQEFSLQIEEMYPRITVESWLAKSFSQDEEQTKTLKNLSFDIAQNLNELLDQQMTNGFDEMCSRLESQLSPVFEKLYTAIQELNNGGVQAIAGTMSEKAGAEIQMFADSLKEMQSTMQMALASSQSVSQAANEQVIATVKQLGDSLTAGANDAAEKQRETTEELSTQVKSLISYMSESTEKSLIGMNTFNQSAQNQLQQTIETTRGATSDIIDNFKNMTVANGEMLKSNLAASKEQLDSTILLLHNTIENHNSSIENSYKQMQEFAMNTKNVINEITNAGMTFKDISEPIVRLTRQLKEQIDINRKEMDDFHVEIVNSLQSLKDNNELTKDNLDKLLISLNNSQERTEQAWNIYKENFEQISGELENTTNIITDRLEKYNEMMSSGMSEQLKKFDSSISNAIGSLTALTTDLVDNTDALLEEKKDRK